MTVMQRIRIFRQTKLFYAMVGACTAIGLLSTFLFIVAILPLIATSFRSFWRNIQTKDVPLAVATPVPTPTPNISKHFEISYATYIESPFIQVAGMMNQPKPRLPYHFVPLDEEFDVPILQFEPGKVADMQMAIDFNDEKRVISDVYGIPKYPLVLCEKNQSEVDCLEANKDFLPDIVFFTKLEEPLSPDYHYLTFLIDGQPTFVSVSLELSALANKNTVHLWPEALDEVDTCTTYYSNQVMVALPTLNMSNVYYALLVPDAQGNIRKDMAHLAYIRIAEQEFIPIFASSMQANSGRALQYSRATSKEALHLPRNIVYTMKGELAGFDKVNIYPDMNTYYMVVPYLRDGSILFDQTLPRTVIGSSSCDG